MSLCLKNKSGDQVDIGFAHFRRIRASIAASLSLRAGMLTELIYEIDFSPKFNKLTPAEKNLVCGLMVDSLRKHLRCITGNDAVFRLLMHCDCDGYITARDCALLHKALLCIIYPDAHTKDLFNSFAELCKLCADKKERMQFI